MPQSVGNPVPTGQSGSLSIPQPQLQNRFMVHVEATPQSFTLQVMAFAMSFAQKKLLLLVEQSISNQPREHAVIQDLIDNPTRIVTLETLDGHANVIDTIKFLDCVVIDHELNLDYSSAGAARHSVVFSYDKIDLGNGTAQTAYASAMGVVGRP